MVCRNLSNMGSRRSLYIGQAGPNSQCHGKAGKKDGPTQQGFGNLLPGALISMLPAAEQQFLELEYPSSMVKKAI